MSRYQNVTFPVHSYQSDTQELEVYAEVFGSGFVHLKSGALDRKTGEYSYRTVLIDPSDIEKLEVALREAKRRRNARARRFRRKLEAKLA